MSKEYTCLGMMSGTSGDGVDASIIRSNGLDKFTMLKEKYYEYDENIFHEYHNLKKKINSTNDIKKFSSSIKKLESEITIFHAKVFKDISQGFNLDLIGFQKTQVPFKSSNFWVEYSNVLKARFGRFSQGSRNVF